VQEINPNTASARIEIILNLIFSNQARVESTTANELLPSV
jgi:hypothetical protein